MALHRREFAPISDRSQCGRGPDSPFVVAGLVPAFPIPKARLYPLNRDRRDQPGDDGGVRQRWAATPGDELSTHGISNILPKCWLARMCSWPALASASG